MFRSIPCSFTTCRIIVSLSVALSLVACGRSSSPDQPAAGAPAGASPDSPLIATGPLTAEEIKAAEEFYRGKTIRIAVGSGAGGGFDTTARLVSRHLARHIPGAPLVIVENMPGAGGLLAANHMFFAAPKDGLAIGIFHEGQVLNQLIGADGVQFDLRKFNWLGSSYVDPNVCIVRADAPVKSFKEMIGNPTPITVGGTGPGSNTYDMPRVLAAATGANLKAVAGYPTTGDARLGVERGELHGVCLGWESVQTTAGQWMQDKYVQVIVQHGLARHKDLQDVPLALDFAKDDESRLLLRLVSVSGAIAKPFALSPGVDASRVRVMRNALSATYQDPAFLEEGRTMKLEFLPKTAPEIQEILEELLATPPDVVAKYKQIVEQ